MHSANDCKKYGNYHQRMKIVKRDSCASAAKDYIGSQIVRVGQIAKHVTTQVYATLATQKMLKGHVVLH